MVIALEKGKTDEEVSDDRVGGCDGLWCAGCNGYDKDGTKLDLKGDFQVQIRQKIGEDQDSYMDYDDLQFGFDVNHELESGVESFGTLEMDRKSQANGDAKAAQAFHWFDREQTLSEFRRIAKPGCCLAILYNERQNDTLFLMAYEEALKKYAGYKEVTHKNIPMEAYEPFFSGKLHTVQFENSQIVDLDGVLGRLSSSSYCPKPGDPNHQPLWDTVTDLFRRYQIDGKVEMRCPTTVYWGKLA